MNILNFKHHVATALRCAATRAPRQPTRRSRAAGFTLLEVAIALVVFVIGALAVLRIFPPALALVQGSESRTIGTRIDKTTLATYTSQPALVPDAVYDSAVTAGNPSPYTTLGQPIAVVGTSSRNPSIPSGEITDAHFQDSGLGHFKRVVGERPTIRQEENSTTGNPLYVLTRYPYDGTNSYANLYREDRVNGVRIHTKNETGFQNGELDFTNGTLASDPNVSFSAPGNPRLPPLDMRYDGTRSKDNVTYYVSYSWQQNGQLQSVIDEPIRITPSATSSQVAQGLILAGVTSDAVLAGSVSVRFRYLFATVNSTNFTGVGQDQNDPYRGFIPMPNTGVSSGTPPPQTLSKALLPGDTISVDYDVTDWRWLVQDDDPSAYDQNKQSAPFTDPAAPTPSATSRTINLPIHPLNDLQTTWLYSLIIAADSSSSQIALFRAQWDTSVSPPSNNTSLQWVDRKSSQVMYDTKAATSGTLFGPRVRTVYQTLDGWAHQLSVAARSYVPYYPGFAYSPNSNLEEAWREYFWTGPGSPTSAADTLYFHASEAGKSILVSYRYSDVDRTGKRITRDASSIITISDNVIGTTNTNFDPRGVAEATLTTIDGKTLTAGLSGPYVLSILAVQGADVRARTAWIDSGRYNQAAVAGYRNPSQTN